MDIQGNRARFVVRGGRDLTVEVSGVFDARAASAFDALLPTLVGAHHLIIDLQHCVLVDEAAEHELSLVLDRVHAAGGGSAVLRGAARAPVFAG
jgi:anti-anti-sigma regulatory factor